MSPVIDVIERGSLTAKHGFQNEKEVADKFNNWRFDEDAQKWLQIMHYDLQEIEGVDAIVLSGHYKTDVQVQVTIYLKKAIDIRNLQVKLVSNENGFNQVERRRVDRYVDLWNMPSEVKSILRRYTGEDTPTIPNPRDPRRMFADEFPLAEQKTVLEWLRKNQFLIVSDILKGRGEFAAEWMLVAQKVTFNARWILKPMNYCLNFFGNGAVEITKQGNFRIGKITMQRKGGDGGRDSAKDLQFKINPAKLFD